MCVNPGVTELLDTPRDGFTKVARNRHTFSLEALPQKNGTSLLLLLLVKNFEEKEIKLLMEQFFQKLPSNDDSNWAHI